MARAQARTNLVQLDMRQVQATQQPVVQPVGVPGRPRLPPGDRPLAVAEDAHRRRDIEPLGQGAQDLANPRAGGVLIWYSAVLRRALTLVPHAWQRKSRMRSVAP